MLVPKLRREMFLPRAPLGLQTRHNLFSGDRMFSYPDSTGIVDCVCQRAWRGADGRLGKAFRSEEPAGLQAIHEYLCLFRDVHDSGKPVGQVADAEVTRARKFAIPWNALRRDLCALDQRSIHIGFGQSRVDDISGVMAIGRSYKPPI